MADQCSHKFVDSGYCLKCGDTLEAIKAAGYDEALALIHELRADLARVTEARDQAGIGWATAKEDLTAARAETARLRAELERTRLLNVLRAQINEDLLTQWLEAKDELARRDAEKEGTNAEEEQTPEG